MAMDWHNRDETHNSHNREDRASFQKHDESMKRFRLDHPEREATRAEIARTVDYFTLLPIRRVRLSRFSPN